MNCEQFQGLVHDLVRDEALDPATVETALNHAESCNACDFLMGEAESLTLGIRSLAALHAPEQASPRIEEVLLSKFAQTYATRNRAAEQRSWREFRKVPLPGYWLAGVAGVAAAAVLFVSLNFQSGATQIRSVSQPQVVAAADPSYEMETTTEAESNTADSFTSLSPTYDSSSLDEDAVVRVVLSDAALESFGVPVNEIGHGPVVADLVVASDGAPQAIRVVGW